MRDMHISFRFLHQGYGLYGRVCYGMFLLSGLRWGILYAATNLELEEGDLNFVLKRFVLAYCMHLHLHFKADIYLKENPLLSEKGSLKVHWSYI